MHHRLHTNTLSMALAGIVLALVPHSAVAGPEKKSPHVRPVPDEPLPIEPSLAINSLPNGLSWLIQPTDDPNAGASVTLVIDAGSIHEPEGTAGAAHLAARLVFSDSKSFAPGELEAAFRQRGFAINRLQAVYNSFDSTMFQIDLPNADEPSLELALRMFADLPGGLTFDEQTVERERAFALRDERVRQSILQRINHSLLPRLFPGTAYAKHLPSGNAAGIAALTPGQLREFVLANYTTDRMTVIVAGPYEPMLVEHAIEHAFEHIKPAQKQRAPLIIQRDAGCAKTQIVLSDPDLKNGVVQLFALIDKPVGVRTARDLARVLSTDVALEALRQRLESLRCDGAPLDRLITRSGGMSKEFTSATIASLGDKDNWREMLTTMTRELTAARANGFTNREILMAQNAVLAAYDQRASNALADQPEEISRRLGWTRLFGGAPVSPAQRAESARHIMPMLTAERINNTFHEIFDPECIAVFILLPESGDAPTEKQVEAIFKDASTANPGLESVQHTGLPRFDPLPDTPAEIDTLTIHPGEQILSAMLANNIRIHHKRIPEMKGIVSVALTIAGGKIDEDERTRGLTEAACSYWSAPATPELSSCDFRTALNAESIKLSHQVGADAVRITMTGPADSAEAIFSSMAACMNTPVLEARVLNFWRNTTKSRAAYIQSQPKMMLNDAIIDAIFPLDDPRHRSLSAEEVQSIRFDSAKLWLEALCATNPIEASIVGDISKARALSLAARSLGTLASRAPIEERADTDDRLLVPRDHPVSIELAVRSMAPNGVALVGFRGPGTGEIDARLNLDIAMRILGARLERALKGEDSGVAAVIASSFSNDAYPDFGFAYAYAEIAPGTTAEALQGIEQHTAELAYNGPTDEEVALARQGALNDLNRKQTDPRWWSRTLSTLTYRGMTPDSFEKEREAINAIDAQSVRKTLEFYHDSSRKAVITITPTPPTPSPPANK